MRFLFSGLIAHLLIYIRPIFKSARIIILCNRFNPVISFVKILFRLDFLFASYVDLVFLAYLVGWLVNF